MTEDYRCVECEENTYSGDGASSCTACPAGKISSAGSTSSDDCSFGEFRLMGWKAVTLLALIWAAQMVGGPLFGRP